MRQVNQDGWWKSFVRFAMRPGWPGHTAAWAAWAAMTTAGGCTAGYYRRQADRDAYRILQDRQRQVAGSASQPANIDTGRPLAEELKIRGYSVELTPEALGAGCGDPDQPPVVTGAHATQSPRQEMEAALDARVDRAPVGQLVDASPKQAATTQPEGMATTRPEGVATTRPEGVATTRPTGWTSEVVEIPELRGGSELFVESGQWPANIRRIDLVDSLQLAAMNSRTYQSQKEAVYLVALVLTGQMHVFEDQFFGTVDASLAQTDQNTRSGTIESALGMKRSFTTGGAMALSISNKLFEVFTDPTGKTANSTLQLAFSQPLLRGAGYQVAAEPLIQANQDVIYAIREFERFKRQLAVDVATSFYRVLQRGDEVTNERNNYINLIRARQRTTELARAGRLPQFQVDQAHQDELRARDRWVTAISGYNESVDGFRRTLGVPTDWPVVPDAASLGRLVTQGVTAESPELAPSLTAAMANRLDLKSAHDRVEDGARRVYVTADALKAGLDLTASATVDSNATQNKPSDFRFEHGRYSMGALLDLPLDRLDERNVYRTAIINLHRLQRNLTDRIDQIAQDIRADVRGVILAENSFHIQESAVKLAQQRVNSTTMLLEAGRVDTRDLLDAQDALVQAQNALTVAMVDYHLARLNLLKDMETLQVEPAGLSYHDPTTEH